MYGLRTESRDQAMAKRERYREEDLAAFRDPDMLFLIDTCSLMEYPNVTFFWKKNRRFLKKTGKRLFVPVSCLKELENFAGDPSPNKRKLREDAALTIRIINRMTQEGTIGIVGDPVHDPIFADPVLYSQINMLRTGRPVLLITQDRDLAADIEDMIFRRSARGYPVVVRRIGRDGCLEKHRRDRRLEQTKKKFQRAPVCSLPDDPLPPAMAVKAGDIVYLDSGTVKLVEKLGRGGEGDIYRTEEDAVVKIYNSRSRTKRRLAKLECMVAKDLEYPGVCFPKALVYDRDKNFLGYMMERARGRPLRSSACAYRRKLERNLPGWKKSDQVQLAITILKMIRYIHTQGMLIGDINLDNILMASADEVYFVDVDSYQIENFPCPVGMLNFTPPEIQGKDFSTFLRTVGNEDYAVAVLLFMLMLPGKPVYSQQGGQNQTDNIMRMDFSYPIGEISNKKTPDGAWRFMWSHLSYRLKEAFYQTFMKGERHATESSRLSVDEWLSILYAYHTAISPKGSMIEHDPMANEMFPTRFKRQ